jgi:hypothetical protein
MTRVLEVKDYQLHILGKNVFKTYLTRLIKNLCLITFKESDNISSTTIVAFVYT